MPSDCSSECAARALDGLTGVLFFFFFNDTATTEIYTLSLHDALPISQRPWTRRDRPVPDRGRRAGPATGDRKSTRLNSSHSQISYAVFCLKKKKTTSPTSSSPTPVSDLCRSRPQPPTI